MWLEYNTVMKIYGNISLGDWWYFLGYFAADGSIYANKNGNWYVALHSADRQIIADIARVFDFTNKIEARRNKNSGGICYRIQVGSKTLSNALRDLGFASNKTSRLPSLAIPKNAEPHFVRGYFDGDGHVWSGTIHGNRKTSHQTLQVGFTSCSEEFLLFLKKTLSHRLKTTGSIMHIRGKNASRLQYSKKNSLQLFDFMYNTKIPSSICLLRKYRVFEGYVNKLRT